MNRTFLTNLGSKLAYYVLLVMFAGVYAGISIVNHAMFRTNACDLAGFTHQIYQLSGGHWPWYTLIPGDISTAWGGHFEPTLVLLAPLRYLFGSYTLLIVQIAFVLLGGCGVYKWVGLLTERVWLPHLAMAHFLSLWGIHAAISFDFHATVLGTMLLPWMLYAFHLRRWGLFAGLALLFLGTSETFGFWGVFIGIALAWQYRRVRSPTGRPLAVWIGLGTAVFSLLYFEAVTQLLMPLFHLKEMDYQHTQFRNLGGWSEILGDPFRLVRMLFVNPFPDKPEYDGHKLQFYLMFLVGGGWAVLVRPWLAVMALPLIAVKMLSDRAGVWGISYHYSVVFVPLLTIGVYSLLAGIRGRARSYVLGALCVAVAMGTTQWTIGWRTAFQEHREDCDLFYGGHWRQEKFDVANVRTALSLIPPDAPVAASSTLAPHLAQRDTIVLFPFMIPEIQYVVALRGHAKYTWPAKVPRMEERLAKLPGWGWETLYESKDVVLLQRPQ